MLAMFLAFALIPTGIFGMAKSAQTLLTGTVDRTRFFGRTTAAEGSSNVTI